MALIGSRAASFSLLNDVGLRLLCLYSSRCVSVCLFCFVSLAHSGNRSIPPGRGLGGCGVRQAKGRTEGVDNLLSTGLWLRERRTIHPSLPSVAVLQRDGSSFRALELDSLFFCLFSGVGE